MSYQVFKDPAGKTALAALSMCPVPGAIAKMTAQEFADALKSGSEGGEPSVLAGY